MKDNKINFQSENLAVDWIGFNIQGSVNILPIAHYLFQNFGFNSTLISGSDRKQKTLFFNSKNNYDVYFTEYKYSDNYWDGIKIDFSGKNSSYCYALIQKREFDWNIFKLPNLSLSRFDLYYFRERQHNDQEDPLQRICSDSLSRLNNNMEYKRDTKGSILRIGNRKSSNFYRIYKRKDGLRFELEIKKNKIKQFSNLLLCYEVEKFEKILTRHFYMYSKKVLRLNNYTNWLIKYLRKNHKPIDFLVTSYFKQTTNKLPESEKIFTFLQFLSFIRRKSYVTAHIYEQNYCLIEFTLKEYMEFSGVKINQYQRNKFISLFYSFQRAEPLITYFTDSHFQSILSFPYLNIQKQGNSWVVKVAMSKLLYDYNYPFKFPSTFLTYQNIYDLRIKLKIIESLSTVPLEKVFHAELFLQHFNVSASKKANIKKTVVKLFDQLQSVGIIKNHYKLIKKSNLTIEVNLLTSLLLGQTKTIYFYEKL
jgi:hypothetical protein